MVSVQQTNEELISLITRLSSSEIIEGCVGKSVPVRSGITDIVQKFYD